MAISMIIQARLNGKSSRSNVHPSIERKQIQHRQESERPNNGHFVSDSLIKRVEKHEGTGDLRTFDAINYKNPREVHIIGLCSKSKVLYWDWLIIYNK